MADNEYWNNARNVLQFWIEIENLNLTRIRTGLYSWQMPDKYKTNEIPGGSRVTQWLDNPSGELLREGILHLGECLECIGTQIHNTGKLVAAVEMALLYRHLQQTSPTFADNKTDAGGGLWLVFEALNKLTSKNQSSFFSGVDELQEIVVKALQPKSDCLRPGATPGSQERVAETEED
jgi:hypothetical protein